MEPTVTIRNKKTGQVRQVAQSQLASFGVNAPMAQSQTSQQDQGFKLTNLLPLL